MWPGPPAWRGCVGRFGIEQAHADQLSFVVNALDDVSVHLQLRDDGRGEVNPGGVQFGKRDGLAADLAQPVHQPLLLGVKRTSALCCSRGMPY